MVATACVHTTLNTLQNLIGLFMAPICVWRLIECLMLWSFQRCVNIEASGTSTTHHTAAIVPVPPALLADQAGDSTPKQ